MHENIKDIYKVEKSHLIAKKESKINASDTELYFSFINFTDKIQIEKDGLILCKCGMYEQDERISKIKVDWDGNGIDMYPILVKDITKIKFSSCVFENSIYINKSDIELSFDNCLVKKKLFFNYDIYKKKTLNNDFSIELLNLEECIFDEKVYFNSIVFSEVNIKKSEFSKNVELKESIIKKINFNDVRFKSFTDFEGTEFEKITFNNIVFENKAVFRESKFKEKTDFNYVTFKDTVIFKNAIFYKKFSLLNAIFEAGSNFLDLNPNNKDKLEVCDRETARIIKDSFEQQNNIIEANKFYALEMKEREKELSFFKEPFEWLVFKIHGISSNHSQDWILSLLWIINISLIVGLFNQSYYFTHDKYIFISFFLGTLFFIYSLFPEKYRKLGLLSFLMLFYILTNVNLDFVANLLNITTIFNSKIQLTFTGLIYKVTMAYLIYQLIISIRQNTRRK